MAYAFLAVVALAMILFYFGSALRERLKPSKTETPTPAPAPAPAPAAPPPAVAAPAPLAISAGTAALDRADMMTNEYIDFLKLQIRDRDTALAELHRENDRLRDDLEQAWRRRP